MIGASAITVINNARTMDGAGVLLVLGVVVAIAIVIAILECRDWLRRRTIMRNPECTARMALAMRLFGKRGLDVVRDIEDRRSK